MDRVLDTPLDSARTPACSAALSIPLLLTQLLLAGQLLDRDRRFSTCSPRAGSNAARARREDGSGGRAYAAAEQLAGVTDIPSSPYRASQRRRPGLTLTESIRAST